jgi:hypothetical protein
LSILSIEAATGSEENVEPNSVSDNGCRIVEVLVVIGGFGTHVLVLSCSIPQRPGDWEAGKAQRNDRTRLVNLFGCALAREVTAGPDSGQKAVAVPMPTARHCPFLFRKSTINSYSNQCNF